MSKDFETKAEIMQGWYERDRGLPPDQRVIDFSGGPGEGKMIAGYWRPYTIYYQFTTLADI